MPEDSGPEREAANHQPPTALRTAWPTPALTPAPALSLTQLSVTPAAPLVAMQTDAWWLSGDHPGGANIAAAWDYASGAGVTVGLVDSAVNMLHQDLAGSVSDGIAPLGLDILSDPHGTRVAGLITGRVDNLIGGVGSAPGAVVHAAQIMYGGTVDIPRVAMALMAQGAVDVSNNSWGFGQAFGDNFRNPILDPIQDAIFNAATDGRGGLGTALVFAAGNGRLMIGGVNMGDDSNFHGLTNSRHTIAVGATDASGQAAFFSSPGTNLLLSAPGLGLVTADGLEAGASGQINVAGTSFAAPLVSGTIALMLQANPSLGYRDIQMILMLTARAAVPVDDAATGLGAQANAAHILNGGGLVFDRDVGFGILDAAAAVRLAAAWTLQSHAANEVQITAAATPDLVSQDNSHALLFTVAEPAQGFALGWVELGLSVSAPQLRQMSIMLESPAGTRALIAPNLYALGNQTTLGFDFSSVATWGEDVAGTWRVILTLPDGAEAPLVHQAELRFFGDQEGGTGFDPSLHYFNRSFAAQAAADPDRRTIHQQGEDPGALIFAAMDGTVTVDLGAAIGKIGGVEFSLEGLFDRIVGGAAPDDLRGSGGSDSLTGGHGGDLLVGAEGHDFLQGDSGADTLSGGEGNDSLLGGAGDDTYHVDAAGDAIFETMAIGHGPDAGGHDRVFSSISLGLDATPGLRFVENLVLTGLETINGTGNDLANRLRGNSADNQLSGGFGNDSLNGGAGHDILLGGAGNDFYVVDSLRDRVFETTSMTSGADAGGLDTVFSAVSFSLNASPGVRFVERLALTGANASFAIGNDLANALTGNDADNVLAGRLGNDVLTGGDGADTFVFNTALGQGNIDRIRDFSATADRIRLDPAIFDTLPMGRLSASAFTANHHGRATDAHDRIIYETDTGRLFHDADGNGAGARVLFAVLLGHPEISAADVFVFG